MERLIDGNGSPHDALGKRFSFDELHHQERGEPFDSSNPYKVAMPG